MIPKVLSTLFSPKNEYNFLKSQVTATYDSSIEGVFTVTQLKMALDLRADYGLIKQMGKELDESKEQRIIWKPFWSPKIQ